MKSFAIRPRADLKQRYPAAKDDALDLLQKILVFNPYFRPNVQECLDHPYLNQVRNMTIESKAACEVYLQADKAQILNNNDDEADYMVLR